MRQDLLPWRVCKNIGADAIPPHSVVRMVRGKTTKSGDTYLEVEQPDSFAFDSRTYVTGELAIQPDAFGRCTREGPVVVACDAKPKPGEIWGPVPDAWQLGSGYPGATIVDVVRTDGQTVLAMIERDLQCFVSGQLAADLDAPTNGWTDPTTGTMTVYRIGTQATAGGDLADYVTTGLTLTLVNRDTGLAADSGAHVVATRIDNEWRPLWVGC